MTLLEIALYFAVAATSGAINSVAGGGTFLTFPVLILGGYSPLTANVTSTVALCPGSAASFYAYRNELKDAKHRIFPLTIASFMGGLIGSIVLLSTPEQTFEQLVPWLLLIATLIFTFGRQAIPYIKKLSKRQDSQTRLGGGIVLQFFIGLYGGYFGAGIGILMLAMLQLVGMTNIHQMNALKTWLAIPINGISVVVFIIAGKVVWPVTLVMLAGALFGGYFGARFALRVKPDHIRLLVSVIGIAMTTYFFVHGA